MPRGVEVVVKVGGSLAEGAPLVDGACAVLARWGAEAGAVVVPGGGAFADTVREADRRLGLDPSVAHRMAVLAMDQYGCLLADRIARAGGRARAVRGRADVAPALGRGEVPVLLPSAWLEAADPLPHSWDVTSDSIAAWVAAACGATRLVLVKRAAPPGARLADLAAGGYLDGYFQKALPAGLAVWLADASAPAALEAALHGRPGGGAVEVAR